jgi:hypothetical protein
MRFKQWLEDTTLMHGGIQEPGDMIGNLNLGCRSKAFGPPARPSKENLPPGEDKESKPRPEKVFGFKKGDRVKSDDEDINTRERGLKIDPQYTL